MILDFGEGYFLRQAAASDHAALCVVALKTGDAGKDATALEDDPDLIGQIYAVPYQIFEPDFAFVVEGEAGVSGYLLGAPDTGRLHARLAAGWYPALQTRVSDPGADRSIWRGSDWARHMIHHPQFGLPAAFDEYPSHGHIDLLRHARGRGIGRRAMAFLQQRLAAAGSAAMHLDVHPRNQDALRFYAGLGFSPLPGFGSEATTYVVKRFG